MTADVPAPDDAATTRPRRRPEEVRELARERLRRWWTTPEAIEEELLDTWDRDGVVHTRLYLLRLQLRELAEAGNETAAKLLAEDEDVRVEFSAGVRRHEDCLRYTRLDGLKRGRRLVLRTPDGDVGPGVVVDAVGPLREARVVLETPDGVRHEVYARDTTGFAYC
jgi:hypothetical protein